MSNLIFMGPDSDRRLGTPASEFGTRSGVAKSRKESNIIGLLIEDIVFSVSHVFPSGRVEYSLYLVKKRKGVDRLAWAGMIRSERIADPIGSEMEYPPIQWEDSFVETSYQREVLSRASKLLVNPS